MQKKLLFSREKQKKKRTQKKNTEIKQNNVECNKKFSLINEIVNSASVMN